MRGGGWEEGVEVKLKERWGKRIGKESGGGSLSLTLIPSNLIYTVI